MADWGLFSARASSPIDLVGAENMGCRRSRQKQSRFRELPHPLQEVSIRG